MNELIQTISEIAKYGLRANLQEAEMERALEKQLIKLYSLYYDVEDCFDSATYPDFERSVLPDIRLNIGTNFKDFGYYQTILNPLDLESDNTGMVDAVDDLHDIIRDLLEVEWRIENNSLSDGLWHFKLLFRGHMQQHTLNLLNYLKQKNG